MFIWTPLPLREILSLCEILCAGIYMSHEGKSWAIFLLLVSVSVAAPEALSPLFEQELPKIYVTIAFSGFRKGRGTRDQIATSIGSLKKSKRVPEKIIYFCFTDYAKTFDCVDHNQLWKILKEMGIPDHLICLLRSLYAGQEVTELDMELGWFWTWNMVWTASKSGKEYVKAVYCHPAYLTSMQSVSCEMVGWMNHKLEIKIARKI